MLTGKQMDITAYKLARKDVYVNSANLGSAFQRMLSEPKNKQKNTKDIHKFVVLNHMLSSYIATLITNLQYVENIVPNGANIKSIRKSAYTLGEIIRKMGDKDFKDAEINAPEERTEAHTSDTGLLYEQLELINKLILDIQKLTQNSL